MKIISRHTYLQDAEKVLLHLKGTLEHEGREYARDCGHVGERWAVDSVAGLPKLIDLLGSGDSYIVARDNESYIVGAEIQ